MENHEESMKRRLFIGGALAGLPITGTSASPQKVKAGDIPTTSFGKAGIKVSVNAQGGGRLDLQPDIPTAAAYVRKRAIIGSGVYTGPTLEYWKKKA